MKEVNADLLKTIRLCTVCAKHLPQAPRPILNFHKTSKILIVGQAPGIRAHESETPWNDPSGDRLRQWMGVTPETFYDPKQIAIVPMGFCYPGTGKSGDLPPRPECAPLWMAKVLAELKQVQLKLIIGAYAHAWFLKPNAESLTENVRAWKRYAPGIIPLPHPSPRNNIWLKKNRWFEKELVPHLQATCGKLLSLNNGMK